MSKLFRVLWGKGSDFNLLKQILSNIDTQENLLGVQRSKMITPEQVRSDIDKAIRYSQSSDYAVWAKESWTMFLDSMDKILKPGAEPCDIDFHRGRMSAILDSLRISHKARLMRENIENDIRKFNK